jgi:hypothetical protein
MCSLYLLHSAMRRQGIEFLVLWLNRLVLDKSDRLHNLRSICVICSSVTMER